MNARIPQIEQFLVAAPADPFLNHALALEWIKEGDDQKAQHIFEEARKVRPEYVATYYHLGKLLERLEKEEEAITVYKEGMKWAKAAGDNHSLSELRGVYEELTF